MEQLTFTVPRMSGGFFEISPRARSSFYGLIVPRGGKNFGLLISGDVGDFLNAPVGAEIL